MTILHNLVQLITKIYINVSYLKYFNKYKILKLFTGKLRLFFIISMKNRKNKYKLLLSSYESDTLYKGLLSITGGIMLINAKFFSYFFLLHLCMLPSLNATIDQRPHDFFTTHCNQSCQKALQERNLQQAQHFVVLAATHKTRIQDKIFNAACKKALNAKDYDLTENIIAMAQQNGTCIESEYFNKACENALKEQEFRIAKKITALAKRNKTPIDGFTIGYACDYAFEQENLILVENIVTFAQNHQIQINSLTFNYACRKALLDKKFKLAKDIANLAKKNKTPINCYFLSDAHKDALSSNDVNLAENINAFIQEHQLDCQKEQEKKKRLFFRSVLSIFKPEYFIWS